MGTRCTGSLHVPRRILADLLPNDVLNALVNVRNVRLISPLKLLGICVSIILDTRPLTLLLLLIQTGIPICVAVRATLYVMILNPTAAVFICIPLSTDVLPLAAVPYQLAR